MPILVHFKAKNNDNSYFYKNSGLSFQWVPYYVKPKGKCDCKNLINFSSVSCLCIFFKSRWWVWIIDNWSTCRIKKKYILRIFISKLIWFARASSHVADVNGIVSFPDLCSLFYSNLSKKCRPWWNAELSSGSSLFAKVPVKYPGKWQWAVPCSLHQYVFGKIHQNAKG